MTYNHISIEPLSTALGAEIGGVDLRAPLPEPALAELCHAFGEYGVIFFRDQSLTPEQHLAFARQFGSIDVNRFFTTVPGYPAIAEVRKEPEQRRNIGNAGIPTTVTTGRRRWVLCFTPVRCRRRAATPCSPACMPPMTRCPMG